MPEECSTVLTSFISKNNFAMAAQNLEVTLNLNLWNLEKNISESDGILRYKDRFMKFRKNILFYVEFLIVHI